MATAMLIAEALPQFCPTTNLYECSDGSYFLVTVPTMDSMGILDETLGIRIMVSQSHLPTEVDVFLCDEHGMVIDHDGDPQNGLTPYARFPAGSHESALSAMGYEVVEPGS